MGLSSLGLLAGVGSGINQGVDTYQKQQQVQLQKEAQDRAERAQGYDTLSKALDYWKASGDKEPLDMAKARLSQSMGRAAAAPQQQGLVNESQDQTQTSQAVPQQQGLMRPPSQQTTTEPQKEYLSGRDFPMPLPSHDPKYMNAPFTQMAIQSKHNELQQAAADKDQGVDLDMNDPRGPTFKYYNLKLNQMSLPKQAALSTAQAGAIEKQRGATGQQLPGSEAMQMAQPEAAAASIDDLIKQVNNNRDLFGPMRGRVNEIKAVTQGSQEGKRAAILEGNMSNIAESVNRALTGGVAHPEMMGIIQKNMGGLHEDPDVVISKLQGVKRSLLEKRNASLSGTKGANFNMGTLKPSLLPDTAPQLEGKSSKPTTVMQGGHTYTLNPKTGKYE